MLKREKDKRVIKSQTKLKTALLTLMKRQSFNSISVISLCKQANINRSTFYSNYDDIYELLNDIYQDLFLTFDPIMDLLHNDVHQGKQALSAFLDENREFFSLLLKNNNNNLFELASFSYYSKKYGFSEKSFQERSRFITSIGGCISLFNFWVKENFPCGCTDLANLLIANMESYNSFN